MILNDGSAREWQRAASQWTPGKNFDGTMPIGPEVVTTDELDVSDVQLTTTLNGEVMQSASTSQMIFDIPRDDRVPLIVHHPAPGRRDRHRYPGRRGVRADSRRSGCSPAT